MGPVSLWLTVLCGGECESVGHVRWECPVDRSFGMLSW